MKTLAVVTAFFLVGCTSAPGIAVRQPSETELEYVQRQVRTEAGFVCAGESLCVEEQLAARARLSAIRAANEPAPGKLVYVVGGPTVRLASATGSAETLAVQQALTDALADARVHVRGSSYPDWIAAETRLHELLEARGIALG